MASSLEQLLADEGFRGRKSGMRGRASFRAVPKTMPLYPLQSKADSSSSATSVHKFGTERTRSDRNQYAAASTSSSSSRPRENLVRREKKNKSRLGNSTQERGVGKGVEIGKEVEEEERVKDIYSEGRTEGSSKGNGEKERHRDMKGKDIIIERRHSGNLSKDLVKYGEFRDDYKRKSMKQGGISYDGSVRGSKKDRILEHDQRAMRESVPPEMSELALDEAVIKAMVSILTSYSKQFLKDGEFRVKLRESCYSALNFSENEIMDEPKVKTNLEQAIRTVENAAEEVVSAKDVKRAALQLSVMAGLNSNDLKDGYTAGIPNSSLSACAHLYLSMIYKLQKKDRGSARHTLQVFCDSPFLARTYLLPELWDSLFLPQLSHLNTWYESEASSLLSTPNNKIKLKLLDKVHNESLDSGTHHYAAYYKDWLTEGLEAPSVPSVHIPSIPVEKAGNYQDLSAGQRTPSYPVEKAGNSQDLPMVSKKLYDGMFGRASKPGVYEAEEGGERVQFYNGVSSSDGSAVEAIPYSFEKSKYLDQDIGKHSSEVIPIPDLEHFSASNVEELKLVEVSAFWEPDDKNEISRWGETVVDPYMPKAPSQAKENETILKSLAKSVFETQKTQVSLSNDSSVSDLSHFTKTHDVNSTYEDLSYEYSDDVYIFSSTPHDFICPLTGQLFEDPVTLETGQTFERVAIDEWLNQGHKTCPVTGRSLACLTVPLTNFIMKRVIDSWKLEHCSHLFALASLVLRKYGRCESRQGYEKTIAVVEKLLTSFSKDENLMNAKHIISLGGLEFLTRSFEFGNVEEKARTAGLFCCCIEADNGCRNRIGSKINKKCLFELLQSRQTKARRNAVFLLIELVCLRRRNQITSFFTGLDHDEITNTVEILLEYLQTCPPEQQPLVSVLLLHLDILVGAQKDSTYRQEAADAISMALENSLTNKKIRENTCRALLILGGQFSASGKLMTESWILKQAGFYNNCEEQEEDEVEEGEKEVDEEWLRNVSASLLIGNGNGKKSFLENISKWLDCGNLGLVRVCLITIAWMSMALCSQSGNNELQLSAFSILISGLKQRLLHGGDRIENKVLASMSLLNLSKILEWEVLLIAVNEEIVAPLQNLAEVTWTAKQLLSLSIIMDVLAKKT